MSRDRERGSRDSERSERGGRETGRGGGRSRFEYKPRDSDAVKRRVEQQSGGDFDGYFRDGCKTFKPKDQDNIIRILPPTWQDAEHYGYDIYLHYGVGPDEQSYLCLEKMKGQPCPICEERARAAKAKDDDYADSLKPKQRVVIALIDRDHENEGVQLWSMPWGVDKDLLSRTQDRRTGEILPLDDPENGYDVEFTKQGKGITTKYVGLALSRRESPLGDSSWLDYIAENPIPDCLVFYSYDHIASVFGGASSKAPAKTEERGGRDKADDDLRGVETRGSSRGSSSEPELTWEGVHSMKFEELCSIIDDQKLKIVADDSKNDEELADWVCEDLNIKKAPARRSVTGDASTSDRLTEMRNRRS